MVSEATPPKDVVSEANPPKDVVNEANPPKDMVSEANPPKDKKGTMGGWARSQSCMVKNRRKGE